MPRLFQEMRDGNQDFFSRDYSLAFLVQTYPGVSAMWGVILAGAVTLGFAIPNMRVSLDDERKQEPAPMEQHVGAAAVAFATPSPAARSVFLAMPTR